MWLRTRDHQALAIDVACLVLAAPLLYFSNWFGTWAPAAGGAILLAGWIGRRLRLGIWGVRTPADWAILLIFLLLLPLSVWVAPETLRVKYSLPRASILLWNFSLFWVIVTYASRNAAAARGFGLALVAAGSGIALLAPLGMKWAAKLPVISAVLDGAPRPLIGVFQGAESGFSPNQVAGALLYALPVALALVAGDARGGWRHLRWWLLALAAALMLLVLGLTQSRAGLFGLLAGVVVILLGWRWGRRLLLAAAVLAALSLALWFGPLAATIQSAPVESAASAGTLVSRAEIWSRAVYGLQDFPFTGMGLGTFRAVIWERYPLALTSIGYDIAHAHNFFLQQGLDFGIGGLIALLAVYLAAAGQIYSLLRFAPPWRSWALGLAAALAAQITYGQLDVVAMGSKPNFLFWMFVAVVFGMGNLAHRSLTLSAPSCCKR